MTSDGAIALCLYFFGHKKDEYPGGEGIANCCQWPPDVL